MKNSINIVTILLATSLSIITTSCSASNMKGGDIKAERISREMINNYRETQTETFQTTQSLPATPTTATVSMAGADQNITVWDYKIDTIDPINAQGHERMIPYASFVGLTRLDVESGEIGSGLAKSWIVSEDGLIWTFSLHENIPWVYYNENTQKVELIKEGMQTRFVQAQDVVFAINRLFDPNQKAKNAYLLENIIATSGSGSNTDNLPAVRALDNATLEIQLQQPLGFFDALAELPIMGAQPEWFIQSNGDDWSETNAIPGYGPYVLMDQRKLIKNPFWVGTQSIPKPSIQTISINKQNMNDSVIKDRLSYKIHGCLTTMNFNALKTPVDSARVRQALSMAVDRQAIIESYLPDYFAAYSLSIPGSRNAPLGEAQSVSEDIYNPQHAKLILLKAFPDISKMQALEIVTEAYTLSIPQTIQQMWADNLGIDVTINAIGYSEYDNVIKSSNLPMIWVEEYCLEYNDMGDFYNSKFILQSDRIASIGWVNATLTKLLDSILIETDQAKRTDLYNSIEKNIQTEYAFIIPLYWRSKSYLDQETVQLHRTYPAVEGLEQFEKWWLEK